jgi:energy-coupling factor transporter ATP-binding protein EcfA2
MSNPPSIPLALGEKENVLHGAVFYERINANRLENLIEYNGLAEKFDTNNYAQEKASQYYENEKQQLINYDKNYKKKKAAVPVRYLRTHKSKIGRVYPNKSLGLTTMSKKTRNTLIDNTMIDIDLNNAQVDIIRNICRSNGIDCPFLDQYCNNREPILQEMMDKYGLSRNACKKLYIRMTLGGTFWGFCHDNNIDTQLRVPTQFIENYQKELHNIAKELIADNDALWKSTKMKIDKENKKIRDTNAENTKWNEEHPNQTPKPTGKREKSASGSFLSKILQEWELRIIECFYIYLRDSTNIVDGDYFVYEYDGMKLIRSRVENYGVIDKLINELVVHCKNTLGFDMKLEVKDMDKIYEDFSCDFVEDVLETEIYDYDSSSYNAMKADFEEENCKIMSSGNFLCKTYDGTRVMKKKSEIVTTYEHLSIEVIKENKRTKETEIEEKTFINMWLKDKNIKRYNHVDLYPPPLQCPSNVFNMWTPFQGQLLLEKEELKKGGFVKDLKAIDMVEKHLRIMCDNDESVYNYLRLWIAQMLKYPAIKSGNTPIFTGEEGGGKTSIFNMLTRIIGREKVVETTKPHEDIWGTYNSILSNAFLVIINELEKKQMVQSVGQIKGLITDSILAINTKGLPQYQINSYHRIMMSTNKEDPYKTKKDDRRTWIIRVSDELIGNKEYFNKFHDMLKRDNAIATLYDYFYNIDGVDNFNNVPKPLTEYQKTLVEINTDIIHDFWKDFSQEHYYRQDKIFEQRCSDVYEIYRDFCKKRGCDFILSNKEFWGKTKTHRIKGITEGQKTNKGSKKRFDINELIAYYGVICDAKDEEDSDDECETE